jgi:hypothetical protein
MYNPLIIFILFRYKIIRQSISIFSLCNDNSSCHIISIVFIILKIIIYSIYTELFKYTHFAICFQLMTFFTLIFYLNSTLKRISVGIQPFNPSLNHPKILHYSQYKFEKPPLNFFPITLFATSWDI